MNDNYNDYNENNKQYIKINKILDEIETIYNKEFENNIYYLENENKELKRINKILEEKLKK